FIVDKLYSENLGDKNEVLHRLLYKVIIVKLNRTHYKVYMPFNHLIFDGMSMEVIKTNIRRAYANNGVLLEGVTGYDSYVDQLLAGPDGISEKELMETFYLHDFYESFKEYNKVFQNSSFKNTTITLEITKDIYEHMKENLFEAYLNIFQNILESNFDMEKVPFVMMYQDRKHEKNNYYNTVGEFLDILPLVLKKGEEVDFGRVHDLIDLACDKNINFSTLMENKDLEKKYQKVSKALDGIYTNGGIRVPVLNYSALYDSTDEDDVLGVKESRLSTEINMVLQKNHLEIRLFCKENNEAEVKEILQHYVNENWVGSTV